MKGLSDEELRFLKDAARETDDYGGFMTDSEMRCSDRLEARGLIYYVFLTSNGDDEAPLHV